MSSASAQLSDTVLLQQGALKGALVNGVLQFLNIPFCQPPTGDLRWRAPRKAGPWEGVRENPHTLSKCPQPPVPFDFEGPPIRGHVWEETEDCLVLNVFTCATDAGTADETKNKKPALRPVIFYIHGGAGKLGSCHADGLSGQQLAKTEDVVYVCANYRLGPFGFLAHPEIAEEERTAQERNGNNEELVQAAGNGNFAVLDLVAALTWVRDNIAFFRGDPNTVTIWGLSTGSQLVHCLLICPQAKGLFHRAIMQSCVDLGNVRKVRGAGSAIWQNKTAEEWGELAGEEWGCARGEGQLGKMREVSARAIADGSWSTATNDMYLPATERSADGGSSASRGSVSSRPYSSAEVFFTEQQQAKEPRGVLNIVPLMIGYTEQDGLGKMELEHLMFEDVTDEAGLKKLLAREFASENADRFLAEFYPHDDTLRTKAKQGGQTTSLDNSTVEQILSDWSKDIWYEAGTWMTADKFAAFGAPVYLYRFDEKVQFDSKKAVDKATWKSSHGGDLRHWGGMKPLFYKEGVSAKNFSAVMAEGGERDAYEPESSEKYDVISHQEPAATALGRAMMRFLGNFADSGDPNVRESSSAAELPVWEKHVAGSSDYMGLGSGDGGVAMQRVREESRERYNWLESAYFKTRVLAEVQK